MSETFRCRTCGKRTHRHKLKQLFDDDDILQKIKILTGIWLTKELNVPSIICSNCLTNLNNAIEFRTRCIKSNRLYLKRGCSFKGNLEDNIDDPLANEGMKIELEDKVDAIEVEFNQNLPYKVVTSQIHSPRVCFCDLCGGSFVDEASLSQHRQHHCSLKDEDEQSDSNLNKTEPILYSNHLLLDDTSNQSRHNSLTSKKIKKPRDFFCDHCGRHFNDNANFNRHVQRHLGVKRYTCEECDYKDYSKHLVNLHTRIQHRGEQPYACKYCGKRFVNSMARLRHQRSHVEHVETETKMVTYTCTLCGKHFVNKSTLDKHAIVHTGEQPFYCEICCIYFNRKSSLQTHYRSKTHQKKATSKLDETGVDSD
ncbi:gastrula zinc finger protein XlCGF8.2DB-like isoform X1 [Drosophila albomicans]|uniref:Gastrula zinc finger protein XlCGF8.2DB-like isoform X1 n=1 Tax=Drosophila albomicans TaxID=7291 RepID=A0A9C6SVT4_DROAB|nr:gastrula zinc finger protein XlCGF8.2DB-like isoform X1 [Drosophila albomicans]